MQNTKFYRLGQWIYRFRKPIISLWLILIVSCIPFIPNIIAPFKITGFVDNKALSTHASNYLDKQLGYNNSNKFLVIYHSRTLLATNPSYINTIKKSLKNLRNFPIKHDIIYPDGKHQMSKDKHTAYVVIIIKSKKPLANHLLTEFKDSIKKPKRMTLQIGGEPLFIESVNQQTQKDLRKADLIATPIAIITLVIVFGSIVAGILPIILGGGCALLILTTLFFLGHFFTLSIFTLNIALLLGLCLSLDYSLFIISRFRDELDKGHSLIEAIAITQARAGKAIFFSGLAVLVSLSALFLFPINILFSVALGGVVAVTMALLTAIILLPAVLSVLDTKINFLSLSLNRKNCSSSSKCWHWLAEKVVKRPLLYFFSVLIFLLMLGYPFLSAKFGVSDFKIFPKHSEFRGFYNTYTDKFDVKELNPILLVMTSHSGPILSKDNISKLYDFTHQLKNNPSIKTLRSIVDTDSKLTKNQYYTLYHNKEAATQSPIKQVLDSTTKNHMTVITIISKYPLNSPQTTHLIDTLRTIKAPKGLSLQLTGTPISHQDVLTCIYHYIPYAILWIIFFTYLILLILLRSIFLPFKAILMNLLSLSACYGALVLVFQDGYFSQLLNFEPQGLLDISILVIIFCALFGFSMDYEVFLLSRIKETYEQTHDNTKSIIFGIEKSSRIITSAAIIVIFLCCSFLVADVLMVKAFGLGIAVAIFVDAFLIRTILVPSTMVLLKEWNWYLPKWLDKLLPKF